MRLCFALVALIALTSCDSRITEAQELVAKDLKDPESAKFRNVTVAESGCVYGEVNAKNSYGAYTGFEKFTVKSTFVTLETQSQDMAWELEYCKADLDKSISMMERRYDIKGPK